MYFVLIIALFIAILLEATIIRLPLVFILLLCYSILNRSSKVFISAFVIGILLDLFALRTLGSTSIYFLLFFALLLLYQRKYEIKTYTFVLVSAFTGSYLYLLFFGGDTSVLRSVLCSILAAVIFGVGKKLKKRD